MALVAWAADLLDADEGDAWDERLRAAVLRDLSAGAGALPVVATAARADDAAGPDARLVTLAAKLARLDRRLYDWNDGHIGDEEGRGGERRMVGSARCHGRDPGHHGRGLPGQGAGRHHRARCFSRSRPRQQDRDFY